MSTRNISLPDHHEKLLQEFKQKFGISASEAIRRGLEALASSYPDASRNTGGVGITLHQENPFICAGYSGDTYYYIVKRTLKIIALDPDDHDKEHLLTLAPISYWETCFPCRAGVHWDSAISALFRKQEMAGIFNPNGADATVEDLKKGLHFP
jgi:hypothetical protein